MHSLLPQASLGIVVALALRWTTAAAEPASAAAPTSPPTDSQAVAKKLTNEAIAAQDAKNYAAAIVLYKQAYEHVPHPILLFNVGQVYMLAGDFAQVEKFYLRYLERDPDGPGAPSARRFLASRPASPPPPPPLAATASAPPRGIDNAETGGEHHDGQPASEPLQQRDEAGPRRAMGEAPGQALSRSREDRLMRAGYLKVAGYTVIGVGMALTAAALTYGSPDKSKFVLGASSATVMITFVGVGILAYGDNQQRVAQRVAWSPMVGSDFAGVAWSGTLP